MPTTRWDKQPCRAHPARNHVLPAAGTLPSTGRTHGELAMDAASTPRPMESHGCRLTTLSAASFCLPIASKLYIKTHRDPRKLPLPRLRVTSPSHWSSYVGSGRRPNGHDDRPASLFANAKMPFQPWRAERRAIVRRKGRLTRLASPFGLIRRKPSRNALRLGFPQPHPSLEEATSANVCQLSLIAQASVT